MDNYDINELKNRFSKNILENEGKGKKYAKYILIPSGIYFAYSVLYGLEDIFTFSIRLIAIFLISFLVISIYLLYSGVHADRKFIKEMNEATIIFREDNNAEKLFNSLIKIYNKTYSVHIINLWKINIADSLVLQNKKDDAKIMIDSIVTLDNNLILEIERIKKQIEKY